ncbi:MAG: hypothetical protein WEB30_01815 [Cyclobacteriaceae bacterium]
MLLEQFFCGGDQIDQTIEEVTIEITDEELQLNKLKDTWNLISANNRQNRTADFPNLALTLSGNYTEGGNYNYSFTGTRPEPSPWPANGNWKFGTNKITEIIRDPGSPDEIAMTYEVTTTNLIVYFNIPDGSAGWPSGRIASVTGDWTFTFSK